MKIVTPLIMFLEIAAAEVSSSAIIRVGALGLAVVGGSLPAALSEGEGVMFTGAAPGESSVPTEGGVSPTVGIGVGDCVGGKSVVADGGSAEARGEGVGSTVGGADGLPAEGLGDKVGSRLRQSGETVTCPPGSDGRSRIVKHSQLKGTKLTSKGSPPIT